MSPKPSLQTHFKGYGKSLSTSLVTGVLGCLGIAGVLALIVQVHQMVTQANSEVAESLTVNFKETPRKPRTPATSGPQRLITVPTGPALVRADPVEVSPEGPEFVEVPPVEHEPDLLVLEDLNDHPFEEKKKETPPKKETRTVKVETSPATQKGPSRAELMEREKRRLAALAGKITRDATLSGARVTPNYPRSARRKGLEGRVVIKVTVGTDGRVSGCQISQSSGHAILDQSALDAARRHRFIPAKNGLGQPVSVKKLMPFSFRLAG